LGQCNQIAARGQSVWVAMPFADALYHSSDGGSTIEPATLPGGARAVAASPDGLAVYAGTGGGTFRSTDAGETWAQMTSDVVSDLALDPEDPSTVYLAIDCNDTSRVDAGIRRSTDAGATWELVRDTCAFRLSFPGSGQLLTLDGLGRTGGATSRSLGGGVTWRGQSNGIPGATVAMAASGNTAYVATTLGLYRADIGGL
jgi:hypothetical protein